MQVRYDAIEHTDRGHDDHCRDEREPHGRERPNGIAFGAGGDRRGHHRLDRRDAEPREEPADEEQNRDDAAKDPSERATGGAGGEYPPDRRVERAVELARAPAHAQEADNRESAGVGGDAREPVFRDRRKRGQLSGEPVDETLPVGLGWYQVTEDADAEEQPGQAGEQGAVGQARRQQAAACVVVDGKDRLETSHLRQGQDRTDKPPDRCQQSFPFGHAVGARRRQIGSDGRTLPATRCARFSGVVVCHRADSGSRR